MSKAAFPEDFLWGVATSSYQVEGSASRDGKGESIWDRFSHTPGAIRTGEVGDDACDHYRLYKQDVHLMKEMGLRGYRFSIAWPRVFPEGRGKMNRKGMDFYQSLVDELLGQGIEPFITLYHWDLPQALQDSGGWANRDSTEYFADYAGAMFEALGDRVGNWITFNEPWCVAFLGNDLGIHAPGLKDFGLAVKVSHHLMLANARAVERYRRVNRGKGKIGITLNLVPMYPASPSAEDARACEISDGHFNRWFLDPLYKGGYPEDILQLYEEKGYTPGIQPGDRELFEQGKVDFLGVNYYMRQIVAASETGRLGVQAVKPEQAKYTEMGWEVFPEGLAPLLLRLDRDYGHPEMLITENGIACKDDKVVNGRVEDDDRIDYLRDHFAQVLTLLQAGLNLRGYFVWTLMDCFEWHDGFSRRFGLASFNQETRKRTMKKSAYWYRDMILANGF